MLAFKVSIPIIIIVFLYGILTFQIKNIETILTFPAVGYNVQDFVGHVETKLEFEELNFDDGKGNNINGLYIGAGNCLSSSCGKKTVYYFHGNGGPLSYFYSEIKYINELGYNVIAYDYPGYGKSTGFPDKKVVDNFSQIFYENVKKLKKINDDELIIWGYSIGTAVATDFASKNIFEKLILVSPLSSRYDMSKKLFGFAIQKLFFIENSYKTTELIGSFNKPVLIIHGNNDKIVPFWQGEKVYKNYFGENKYFIEIDNFGHNGIIDTFGESLKYKIGDFLKTGKIKFLKNNYLNLDRNYIDKKGANKERFYMLLDKKRQEILEEENKIKSLDIFSDNSFTKFVNNKISFNNLSYIPENLVSFSGTYINDIKGTGLLRKIAMDNLVSMNKVFYDTFGENIKVVSSYRSYLYQKGIKDRGCPDNLCAKAGYSEHQSGLAIDLWETTTNKDFLLKPNLRKYFEWLNKNAYKYGFINTYQKGVNIDGYEIEPWHWRYVGITLAKYLNDKNITFAEFYYKKDLIK